MSGLHIKHKRNNHALRWAIAIILVMIGLAYAYFGARWYSTGELSPLPLPVSALIGSTVDESQVTSAQKEQHKVAENEPQFLDVPKLNITGVRIQKVGVTETNILAFPANVHDAGWYTKSALPGAEAGVVLLSGHASSQYATAVFSQLSRLSPGDQLTVTRGDGETFTYEVHDIRKKSLVYVNQTGMKEMMKSVDPSKDGLSIITDAGRWVPKFKTHDHRLLVRATLVE